MSGLWFAVIFDRPSLRLIHEVVDPRPVGAYACHGGKIVFFGRFVAFLRTYAALLAGINRMSWPHFLMMNALGGICWATLFGGGAYLFGVQMKRVAGPVSLLLLLAAIGLVVASIFFFRHHEKELERRAEAALPGPWLQRGL